MRRFVGVGAEFWGTFPLVLVGCGSIVAASGGVVPGWTVPAAFGLVVGLPALCFGPLTGASLNPARSLGPVLPALHPHGLWIYLMAPVTGTFLAVATCRRARGAVCCTGPAAASAGGAE